MQEYKQLIESVLKTGQIKENRTGIDTISNFGESYKINLQDGFPILTTKKMDGYRWDSLIHEILWYLSGEEHIDNLTKYTSIWDAWADDENRLDTAYGRFWRRYPIPSGISRLDGETWADNEYVTVEEEEEGDYFEQRAVFDQIQYILDQLNNNPKSRRLVLNAWHPANAAVSSLPPCHYSAVFNVQNIDGEQRLNCHLSQRSADIALGVPFNIAGYAIITKILAQKSNMEVGEFHHTLVDAHIYCGEDDRSQWYKNNLEWLQERLESLPPDNYDWIADAIEEAAEHDEETYDHIPDLLRQRTRHSYVKPELEIADKDLEDLEFEDFTLKDYQSHDGIYFGVAE